MAIIQPDGFTQVFFDNDTCQVRFDYKILNQSITNNTSEIHWELTYAGNKATFKKEGRNWSVKIDNQSYNGTVTLEADVNTQILASGITTIKHNADGTKAIVVSFSQEINAGGVYEWWIGTITGAATFELPALKGRAPKLLNAPNFNDEQTSLYITYSNPAGATATSLQACIGFTSDTDGIPYRNINREATGDYIVLTAEDQAIFRAKLNEGYKDEVVKFYLKGVVDGVTYTSSLVKTLTFINYEPVITNIKIIDADERTTRVTGAPTDIFVKGKSDISYQVTAQGRKGASIGEIQAYCGDNKIIGSIGHFKDIETDEFEFYAIDTRGDVTKVTKKPSAFIPYFNPTANLSTEIMTREGNLTFTVKGKYYNGAFGAIHNSLELEYALIDNEGNFFFATDGESSGWIQEGVLTEANFAGKNYTYSVDESGNYTYTTTITGIDTKKTYTLEVNVFDEIVQEYKVNTLVSVTPLFDWNKRDFHHHTNVKIDGSLKVGNYVYGAQNILWSGSLTMGANDNFWLSDLISNQPNGIMLVFSLVTDGVAQDTSFNTFFVSKLEVMLHNGAPHTFLMGINAGFSVFGAKYLYIENDKILGQATNDAAGSNNGISYNNRRFVLRYVLGV